MAIISFFKEKSQNLSIEVTNVNGLTYEDFKVDMEDSDISTIEDNLNNLNINFGAFCKRGQDMLISETWIDVTLEINVKTENTDVVQGLLQMDSKYTQMSKFIKNDFENGEAKFVLDFYRSRWSGPIDCTVFLNDKDGNLISHTQQIKIYSDGRERPSLASGLFAWYSDDFTTDVKIDQRKWKKIAQKLGSQNQLSAFDREPGSKKIAIWLNSGIPRIKYLSKKPERFKGRSVDSGIFGLMYLAASTGPFMVYLHEVIINVSEIIKADDELLTKLNNLFNSSNIDDVEASKTIHSEIKTNLESQLIDLSYEAVRLLAINLYDECDTVDQKILNFVNDACNFENHFKLFQRGNLAYQKAFKADTWINNNLRTSVDGEE
jgi:hypothetical protein